MVGNNKNPFPYASEDIMISDPDNPNAKDQEAESGIKADKPGADTETPPEENKEYQKIERRKENSDKQK
jgi:hypothetical protein